MCHGSRWRMLLDSVFNLTCIFNLHLIEPVMAFAPSMRHSLGHGASTAMSANHALLTDPLHCAPKSPACQFTMICTALGERADDSELRPLGT